MNKMNELAFCYIQSVIYVLTLFLKPKYVNTLRAGIRYIHTLKSA